MGAKEKTREYFDSLWLEQRLMDSGEPDTSIELYGKKFATPVMTAALSHLGKFHPDMPDGMVEYARGAAISSAVHWIGMGSDEEFARVTATGAQTIRIIKPYADEEEIFRRIRVAEEHGALAVGMDIDHMFDMKGNPDVCLGDVMAVKSSADLKRYIEATKLPFIIKGVLSVQDAVRCAEMADVCRQRFRLYMYCRILQKQSVIRCRFLWIAVSAPAWMRIRHWHSALQQSVSGFI